MDGALGISIVVESLPNVLFTEPGDSGSLYLAKVEGRWLPFAIHRGRKDGQSYATAMEDIVKMVRHENGLNEAIAASYYINSVS